MANPEWDNYEPREVRIREAIKILIENGYRVSKGGRGIIDLECGEYVIMTSDGNRLGFDNNNDALDGFLGRK